MVKKKMRCAIPNWCENQVHITGSKEDVSKLQALIGDTFDFNALIPMPKEIRGGNCGMTAGNTVVRVNPRSKIFHMYNSNCFKTPMDFSKMWSKKLEGGNTAADAINIGIRACKNCMVKPRLRGRDFDKPLEVGAALVKEFGYDNWYDWSIANWGTKWQPTICVDFGDTWASSDFLTAWSPPEGIYNALVLQFPDLEITWHYSEPGAGFSGDFDTGQTNDFADPCDCGDCEGCGYEDEGEEE